MPVNKISLEPKPIAYEFLYNGRCNKNGSYRTNQTRVISAFDIGTAERELKRDYLTIDIYYKGLAL